MLIRIHGARGSHPVSIGPNRVEEIKQDLWKIFKENPMSSWDEINSKLEKFPRHLHQTYGGATTCIEVVSKSSPLPIFIDAGTGFSNAATDKNSGLNLKECALFFTHTHWDHIAGLITAPQLYNPQNKFHFYGIHKELKERLLPLFDDRNFPVPFSLIEDRIQFHQIELGSQVQLGNLTIQHQAQSHPGGSFAYRFKDDEKIFVMATDTDLRNISSSPTNATNFYSNADLLILDAHFAPEDYVTRENYGHLHFEHAIDFGVRENAKMLYLFHQSPFYSDKEIDEHLQRARSYAHKTYPQSKMMIRIAFEGEEISL